MNVKADFSKRLKAAMERAGYPARSSILEREFNSRYWGPSISTTSASNWLNGKAIPKQDKLQVLAEWLQVEPQALRFGEQAVSKIREVRGVWENPRYYAEREIFEAYLALPLEQRKVVREIIRTFARDYENSRKS